MESERAAAGKVEPVAGVLVAEMGTVGRHVVAGILEKVRDDRGGFAQFPDRVVDGNAGRIDGAILGG